MGSELSRKIKSTAVERENEQTDPVSLVTKPVLANSPFSRSICLQSVSLSPFALFLTAVWLLGEDNPRVTMVLSHAKEEVSFSNKQREVSDWLRHSCPCRCRPTGDLEGARRRLCPLSCLTAVITGRHRITCVCVGEGAAICVCVFPCLRACLNLYRLSASVCVCLYSGVCSLHHLHIHTDRGEDIYCVCV